MAISTAFGLSVFLALFFGMQWRNAMRWRYLSETYASDHSTVLENRKLQNAILLGLGGYNSLKGIVNIGVSKSGIALSILKPFSLFHAPLFIPFSDIRGWSTTWYIDGKSSELNLTNAPDVKIVMPREQVEWIRSYSGGAMQLSDESPPQGKAGRGAYFFVLINAIIALIALAYLGWQALAYLFV
ncbi:MAG: hypothetical protein QNJ29_09880 [Rhizobiaceae bacterium]|nr:hypothetical protein [Rhizobiaceae bacterium]